MFSLAIDARNLARDHRGLGRYVRAVTRELLLQTEEPAAVTLVVDSLLPKRKARELQAALGTGGFAVANKIPKRAHVAWHPWNGVFARSAAPNVVTLADAGPFLFPARDAAAREHQQRPFREAVARARTVITISHSAAADLTTHLGVEPNRLRVTYLGVDPIFTPGEAALPANLAGRPYFLFVGDTGEERKNFDTLYAAFRNAWPAFDGPAIVVVGPRDPARPGIVHVTVTSDETLRSLYRGALATCVPSLYEGFGMPVVESMACATAVVCSTASSLPEAAGDAAMMVDPQDIEGWSRAMMRIADDGALRGELIRKGLVHAAGFQWERCAHETLSILKSAATVSL